MSAVPYTLSHNDNNVYHPNKSNEGVVTLSDLGLPQAGDLRNLIENPPEETTGGIREELYTYFLNSAITGECIFLALSIAFQSLITP